MKALNFERIIIERCNHDGGLDVIVKRSGSGMTGDEKRYHYVSGVTRDEALGVVACAIFAGGNLYGDSLVHSDVMADLDVDGAKKEGIS